MRTLEELKECYTRDLLPELEVLEKLRKKAKQNILAVFFIVIPVAGLVAWALRQSGNMAMLALFGGIFVCGWFYYFFTKDYVSHFKTGVIEKIVKFIDPGLTYKKFGKIDQSVFTRSGIFRQRIDVYRGDDHVSGKLGKTMIEFSELYVAYEVQTKNGKQEHKIFKGLFFRGDFNKHFNGKTYVLPDKAERFLGNVGTMFQSMNKTRGDLVKLEDPDFEKLFAVYGDDQIEARYILSTSLMKRIVDFQKKTGKQIYMSFAGSSVFVGIPYGKDLFEPRVFRTVLDFKPIQEYFEDLQLVAGMVDDLNLNTRIWTKR